jgi:hypothetical protein
MTVLRAEQPSGKDERYREIVSVFARNGIGILEERFSKHDVDQARAAHLRAAMEELGGLHQARPDALDARRSAAECVQKRAGEIGG